MTHKTLMVLFSVVFLLSFASAGITEGLVVYYPLDEASGDLANSVGDNYTLTPVGSPTYSVPAHDGSGILIDSTNEGFSAVKDTPNHTSLNFGTTGDFAVSLWVNYTDESTGFPMLINSNGLADPFFSIFGGDGVGDTGVSFRVTSGGAGATVDSNGFLGTNEFHNVIAIRNNSGQDFWLYIDGVLNNSLTGAATQAANITNFVIGNPFANRELNAVLDDIRIYNRTLTEEDISTLSATGVSSTINSPSSPAPTHSILNVTSTNSLAGSELANVTLYVNGTINETKTITGNENTSIFYNIFNATGGYAISFITCTNNSICLSSTNTTISVQNAVEDETLYPSSILVGETGVFASKFTVAQGLSVSSANFVYNGVVYSASIDSLSGNAYNLTRSLTIPQPDGTLGFFFNITLDNSDTFSSTNYTITISDIGIDDCSAYSNVLYNFTLINEKTQQILSSTGDSTNVSLNLQLYTPLKSTLVTEYNKTYTETNPVAVCLENSLNATSEYVIDLELQYGAKGYANEFYNIFGSTVTGDNMNTNITLYDLDNESSQEFKITYRDVSYLPVENAVLQLQRKYIGEGVFKTVEQPKTDSSGEALVHMELSDAVYTIIFTVNGVVDATFNNIVPVCQNPAFNDCEISLTNAESFVETVDFANLDDFSFTGPTYNKTTRVIESIFSIPSGDIDTVVLNVTLFDNLGSTQVCSSTVSSSSGTLSCTVPTSFGNSTVIATLYKGGSKVGEAILSLAQDPQALYGGSLVVVALIVFVSLIGIGVSGNPIVMAAFLVLSGIALVGMQVVYSAGFIGAGATIVWFIIAVIIIMIKGANRV